MTTWVCTDCGKTIMMTGRTPAIKCCPQCLMNREIRQRTGGKNRATRRKEARLKGGK